MFVPLLLSAVQPGTLFYPTTIRLHLHSPSLLESPELVTEVIAPKVMLRPSLHSYSVCAKLRKASENPAAKLETNLC